MSKLQLLKILFPAYFGVPRPVFQLNEIREMIEIIQNKEIVICEKTKTITTTFDVSEDIDGIKFMKKCEKELNLK